MAKKFNVIGISDSREQEFTQRVQCIIAHGKVFSGGIRHREIMEDYLPSDYKWIDITVPLDNVFSSYADYDEITVFASGDPLFYGFANTIKNRISDAEIKVYPSFNSLQMLAHRCLLPYSQARMVSLTGREWRKFDAALIRGEEMIGVLTDRHKTPSAIARRMLYYGYGNYKMHIGEMLGNESEERCRTLSLEQAAETDDFKFPNALILERISERRHPLGIPEGEFALLDGRTAMITKMPVRLLTLSMLDLSRHSSMWDIGFCTGSVSIEARLQYPDIDITSFEIRPQCAEIIETNARRFGAPGITAVNCDFMKEDLSRYPAPDAVFIGGHSGQLVEMLHRIAGVLKKGGTIVLNSVTEKSRSMFIEGVSQTGMQLAGETHITIDRHNPITILKATK